MTVIFGDYLSVNNLNSRNEGSGVLFHFSLFIYGDMDVFGLPSVVQATDLESGK